MRLALILLKHIDIDGHARGVCLVSLNYEREVNGVNGVKSCAALFDMSEKSGGEDASVNRGGVAQLADPHVVDDSDNEDGGAADAHVLEGVIINACFPDSLKFLSLVYGILQDGGIGANALGHGKSLALLHCVGVRKGDNAPEVVFCMGLVVS